MISEDKNIQLGAVLLSVITFFTCLFNIRGWFRLKKYVHLKLLRGTPSFFLIAERYLKLSPSEKEVAAKVLKRRFNFNENDILKLISAYDIVKWHECEFERLITNRNHTEKCLISQNDSLHENIDRLKIINADRRQKAFDLNCIIENQNTLLNGAIKDVEKLKKYYECKIQDLTLELLSVKSKSRTTAASTKKK